MRPSAIETPRRSTFERSVTQISDPKPSPGEAIGHLRAVLALEPIREMAVRDLMRTLSESGQAASALFA